MKEPTKKCDLVLKGGLTSGVVYPKLITELAKEYRFMNIGGTSAGAIAAGLTAAAEFNRRERSGNAGVDLNAGFDLLDTLPDDVGKNLEALFQPSPEHKWFFNALLKIKALSGSKVFIALCQLLFVLAFVVLVDLIIIGAFVLVTDYLALGVISFHLLNIALQMFLVAAGIAVALVIIAFLQFRKLKHSYFGFCSGRTERGYKTEGLTNWLNMWVERCAGRMEESDELPEKPLTFGMLKAQDINLKTITTNLSQSRLVHLPNCDHMRIKKTDLRNLFPANVANYVEQWQNDASKTDEDEYLVVPRGDDMPVLMGMRLSLSFPVLLAAVPFYKKDRSLKQGAANKDKYQLCWYSDGGISSNFPIHLFDSIFPSWPTFGISLGEFSEDRQDPDPANGPGQNRIYLPMGALQGRTSPIGSITDLFGFFGAILNTAKDWRDLSQSVLPGYRERIVRIYLNPEKEGGLNLSMPPEVIGSLTNLGELAGKTLSTDFNLNEHRWRRLLSAYAALEECMLDIKKGYGDIDGDGMAQFLKCYQEDRSPDGTPRAKSYPSENATRHQKLLDRLEDLYKLAGDWSADPIRDNWQNKTENKGMPSPAASLKIRPSEQKPKETDS